MTAKRVNYRQKIKDSLIKILDGEGGHTPETEIYADMLFNVGQIQLERLDMGDLRLFNTATRELRYALGVFKRYRSIPKAAVFGSARTRKDHPDYLIAKDFGRQLANCLHLRHQRWLAGGYLADRTYDENQGSHRA